MAQVYDIREFQPQLDLHVDDPRLNAARSERGFEVRGVALPGTESVPGE